MTTSENIADGMQILHYWKYVC